jgi:hypothetical protein
VKIEEQPKIRFRSREGFCLASLGMRTEVEVSGAPLESSDDLSADGSSDRRIAR